MRLKIISDGTAHGTKIVDEKTGEAIENALMVSWSISTEEAQSVVMLELQGVSCDIVTEARNIQVAPMVQVPDIEVEDTGWEWFKLKHQDKY